MELEEFESSKWVTYSDKETKCQCDHYKAIMDLNRLSINMITTQESILLDLIDFIEDKEQQRKIIEKVLAASKKKFKLQVEAVDNPTYNMTEVLSRRKKKTFVYSRFKSRN